MQDENLSFSSVETVKNRLRMYLNASVVRRLSTGEKKAQKFASLPLKREVFKGDFHFLPHKVCSPQFFGAKLLDVVFSAWHPTTF